MTPGPIIRDKMGNIYLTWQDNRSGTFEHYSQKIDSSGYTLWADDGVLGGGSVSVADGEDGFNDVIVSQYSLTAGDFDKDGDLDLAVTHNRNIIIFFNTLRIVRIEDNIRDFKPENFLLNQNYPNPFNPSTKIKFALPEAGLTWLIIYDLLGMEVTRLMDGQLSAGYHSLTWNATSASSGIYFYRLTSGSFAATKKMVLLK